MVEGRVRDNRGITWGSASMREKGKKRMDRNARNGGVGVSDREREPALKARTSEHLLNLKGGPSS